MRVVLSLFRKEFLQLRRDPRLFPVIFISPVLQLLLLGYAANLDVRDIPAVVCDMDRSAAGREVLEAFFQSGYFSLRARVERMEDIDRLLDRGEAALAFVVPRGFGRRLAAGRPGEILIIADGAESSSAMIGLNAASVIAGRAGQRIIAERIRRTAGPPLGESAVVPQVRVWYNPELKSRNFMVPGVLGLILMIMTISLASVGLVREKEAGTMEQLIVTPIRPWELIVGKLLPFVLIGLIDASFVIAVAQWWFHVPVRGPVVLLFGLSIAFMLNTLAIGLFVSTVSRTQQQAMFTAVFFVMPMILLGGFVFPIENMPRLFQVVSYAVPTRYFFVILRGLMLRGAGWPELWPQAAALLGLGTTFLTLSVLRFRKKLE